MKVSVGCQGRGVNPFLQPGAVDHTCSRAAFYESHSMQMQFLQPGESLDSPNQHSGYHESDRHPTSNGQLDFYDNVSYCGHDYAEESSVGVVSSCTNLSQDELRIAEVNPVTFEVMPSSLRHRREKVLTEHVNNSSSFASSAHSPSKPCDKVDVAFDGESGYPTVCLSECHCALPMSPRKTSPVLQHLNHVLEGNNCSRIKLMCSFGGRIQPRPGDGQLRYTGGETRIVAVNRGIGFAEFMCKMTQIYGAPVVLKYQLPGEDLDALISVSSDDDFQNMIEEYDKLELNGGVSRLRLFFFTYTCEHETQAVGLESDMKDCHIDLEQHYIGVRNGITEKLSGLHLKDVPDSLPAKIIHEVPNTMIGLSGSRHLSRVPSAPSSSPPSPSVGSRLRGLCMGEVLNENTGIAVHTHGGDVNSLPDGYTELVCPFHCDHQPHILGESPKTLYDNPFSKVDGRWGLKTGVHGLDSQVNFVNQSEHHIDQISAVGPTNKWHDAQHPPDMFIPAGGFICHHHQPHQVSQQTPLTTGQLHVEDIVGKAEAFQHCPLDMCKPAQAFYHPFQVTPHLLQAGCCCIPQPLHNQYAIPHVSDHSPFMQGPLHSHLQVPYGVAGTTAYKLGSAPSSPRVRIQDIRGNCNCIQHTQVHRGINVSLGDGNRTLSSFDQSSRKPGLPICSRFCDNLANSNEPSGWQKHPSHFIGFEGDQQEHIDNSWQHIHDMGSVHYHMADSQEDTNALHYHHTPLYNETALQQPHDGQAANKKRYPGFNCNESGRQPIDKARACSAYVESEGQIGDCVSEERVSLLERALENLPFHRDENYDCEIYSVGSFSSTDAIAGSLSRAPSDKVWFDTLPHLQTEDLCALDELPIVNSGAHFTVVPDGKNIPSVGLIEMKEEGHGYSVPVVVDTLVGESVLDLHSLSPSVNEPLEAGYENQIATFPHALSSITTSKLGSRAMGGWQALPSNSLSITTLEKSPTNATLPLYDQSPLSSSNTANFSFEQRQDISLAGAEQTNTTGREFTDDRSFFTEELIPKGGGLDDIHKVKGNAQPCSESTTEAVLRSRSMEDVSSPHSLAGQGKGGVLFEAGQHDVKVPEEWSAGVLAVIQEKTSNPVTHEVGSVCTKEFEDASVSEAEKEAIARGLQIIKNDDLEDLKELGSGTYGTVFHGKWRGSDVAIKRIKASYFTGRPSVQERLLSDFWREAGMLSQLHHPNIVAFYGVVPDGPGGTLATVTEYMVNGSLKQVLQKKDRTIDRKKRLLIAMDAAFGMEYLHSKNVVHFDLKSENLLVNMRDAHRPICKVGDFGLSKVKHQTLVSGGVRGTLPWMAPELLSGKNGRVTEKVDVFSFGIVMWELLTGDEPYASMHCGAIIGGIVNNTLRPPVPNWCDPYWRSLMERCWSGDPADRPTFTEVARELRAIAASMNVK